MAWVELSFIEDLFQNIDYFDSDRYWSNWDTTAVWPEAYALPGPTEAKKIRVTFAVTPNNRHALVYAETVPPDISEIRIRAYLAASGSITYMAPVVDGQALMDIEVVNGSPATIGAIEVGFDAIEYTVANPPGGVVASIISMIEYETLDSAPEPFWTAYDATEEVEI